VGGVRRLTPAIAVAGRPARAAGEGNRSLSLYVSALVDGIAYGITIALLGLGFTLSVGTSRIVNFAQGEVYMAGAFAGAAIAQATSSLMLALAGGLIVGALANVILYELLFLRLRHLPMVGTLVTGIGAAFAIEALWGQVFGVQLMAFPQLSFAQGTFVLFGTRAEQSSVVLVIATIIVMAALYVLLFRTPFGLRVRALQDSLTGAEVIGLNVPRVQAQIFAISGALSGLAGVLISWQLGAYQFTMGEDGIGLAFAAAIIGGMGSIPGAVIGGITLGVARSIGGIYDSGLTEAYPYIFLIAVLLIRPTGLFGRKIEFT
jgi:branched-chain amino acid transport system permease protein